MNFPASNQNNITVAIAFDQLAPKLLQHATSLAERTGAAIHLVNVAEPIFYSPSFSAMQIDYMRAETMERLQIEKTLEAEKKLAELARSISNKTKVTHKVVSSAFVTEAIIGEAAATNGAMILCGVGHSGKSFVPRGFSTALSLMANAPLPVMTFKESVQTDWNKGGIRLMVADDGRDAGLAALRFATHFAKETPDSRISHVHVTKLTENDFNLFVKAAMNAGESPLGNTVKGDAVYDQVKQQLENKLQQRARDFAYLRETDARYEAHLLAGDVNAEITKEAERFQPNAIIFGRHITLHRKPFGIGNVPYRTMLQQDFPIIVVPS